MKLNLYLVDVDAAYLQVCPDAPDAESIHVDARGCDGHPALTTQRLLVKAPDPARALQEAAKKLAGAYKWIISDPTMTRVTQVDTGETEAHADDAPTLPGFGRPELDDGHYTDLILTRMADERLPGEWKVYPAMRTIEAQVGDDEKVDGT